MADPDIVPPAPRREDERSQRDRITCEFCGCSLASDGSVLKMSPDARKFRDLATDLGDAQQTIDHLRADIEQIKGEKKDLKDALDAALHMTSSKKNWLDPD